MSREPLYLSVIAFLTQCALAFNCSVPPIYVDVHKRAVSGTNAFQYGSFMGVGSPAQNQSLWPSLRQNETAVADPNFCRGSQSPGCGITTGGFFDASQSRS